MNIKDFILPLTFVFFTTLTVQYLFQSYSSKSEPIEEKLNENKSFLAPESRVELEPLDLEVDFNGDKPDRSTEITSVITNNKIVKLSNNGGIIEDIVYDINNNLIESIKPQLDRTAGAFLVALNGLGNSPYYYELIGKKDFDDYTTVTYKAESTAATIIKEFIIYKDGYKIDLKLTVDPKEIKNNLKCRIFFPAPAILTDYYNKIDGVFYSVNNSIERKPISDIKNFGKQNPTVFGLESHYFLNILSSDPNKFARRAYFKLNSNGETQAILESPNIIEKTDWHLSFYCGPKEIRELNKVDKRLELLLDYGWFNPLCKAVLKLLDILYRLLKNYGFAIIIFTFVMRLVLVPFSFRTKKSRKKAIEAKQKLSYLEQKYKNDPDLLQQARLDYTKSQSFTIMGTVSMLIQLPMMLVLSRVLANGIQLYKAPFLWIPDLSMPDPYYVLPFIIGLGFLVNTLQNANIPNKDKNGAHYVTNGVLALIITALVSNASAGLSLYLGSSALFAIAQIGIQKALKL